MKINKSLEKIKKIKKEALAIEYYNKIKENVGPFDWKNYLVESLYTSKTFPYNEILYFIKRDKLY